MRRFLVAVVALLAFLSVPSMAEAEILEVKRCPQFEHLFRKHKMPVRVFSYISWRESRCRPSAVNARWRDGKIIWTLNKNGTYDSGLLQINSGWKTVTAQVCRSKWGDLTVLFDPKCNVAVAAYLFHDGGGLGHWGM